MSRDPFKTTTDPRILTILAAERTFAAEVELARKTLESRTKEAKDSLDYCKKPSVSLRPCEVEDVQPGAVLWLEVHRDGGETNHWFWLVVEKVNGEPRTWQGDDRPSIGFTEREGHRHESINCHVEIMRADSSKE